jgi:hypothetical protein
VTLLFIDNSDENNFIITNYLPNSKTGLWLAIKDFSNQRVNYYTNESLTFTYWTSITSRAESNKECTFLKKKRYLMGRSQ